MSLQTSNQTHQFRLRTSAFLTLALAVLASCDRFKTDRAGELAIVQRQFDSATAVRDSILLRAKAEQDSMFAIGYVQPKTERVHLAPLEPMPMRGKISRAESLGDSIAQARADELIAQTRTKVKVDTLRGVIRLEGSPPAARPVLMIDRGATKVALNGMGTDGLNQLAGSEVVVRGMLASPHDIVVSGFSVRAVNGLPVIDGRLYQPVGGGWALELSDRTGTRKFATIPQALQAFEGARVWIVDEPGKGDAQLSGVISRR